MLGDLHIHTNASDGALSPRELVVRVGAAGFGFFSVTDHNSTRALRSVAVLLGSDPVRFVPGVELSAQPDDGRELHILGYGIDPSCAHLQTVCDEVRGKKRRQVLEIVRRLGGEGIRIEASELPLGDDAAYVGRPMLADMLVSMGAAQSVQDAFGLFLGERAPTFAPMDRVDVATCIGAVHAAGGLAVLAHPTIEIVDRWIAPLADAGLDGVEAYRPALSGNAQLYVEKAAEHFRLLVTGGSDWHGRGGGLDLGEFAVSEDQVREFLAALG